MNTNISPPQVNEISQTMMELQKEMTKAGIMEEMMEDTMGMDSDEVRSVNQSVVVP